MARAPQTIERSAQLNPVASPVDTYVRPAPSPLRDLATSLSQVDRNLQGFMESRKEKQDQEDAIRGEALFHQNNGVEYAEAVRRGLIPAQNSPTFVRSWKNAQGLVAGGSLREKFNSEFDAWDGKNSEDPAAFDTFLQDFLKTNLQSKDPDVLRGILPSVREIQANGRARYIDYRHQQTYNGSLDANTAAALQDVDRGNEDGLASANGTNYEAVYSSIDQKRAAFIASGGRPEDFDKSMMVAMSAKILELKDPGLLSWFDRKIPGTDRSYKDTPDGLKLKNSTLGQLEAEARRSISEDAEKQRLERTKKKDEAVSGIIQSIIADPSAPVSEDLLKQAEQNGEETIRTKIPQWRKDLATGISDPAMLKAVTEDIIDDPTNARKYVMRAMDRGVFKNNEDLKAAFTFADNAKGAGDSIKNALGSKAATDILGAIVRRTTALDKFGNPVTGMSNDAMEAQFDYRRMVTEWLLKNPDATTWETEEQIQKFGKLIMDRMNGNLEDIEEVVQTYDSPNPQNPYFGDNAGKGEEDGTSPEQPAGQAQPQQKTEAAPSTPAPTDADVQKFWKGLDPEKQRRIQDLAGKLGKTKEDIIKQGLVARPQAQAKPISFNPNDTDPGEGDARTSGLTPEQASGYIEEALSSPDAADFTPEERTGNLLSLLRHGEARGNYNAVFGGKGDKDLSKFTLDEIMGHQQDARARGLPSTAIGGYQFLYKTLRGLKQEMGLTGAERFTPQLQDRLGLQLLKRRGLDEFLAGKISKRQFAFRLSQEWAALPNPNTGRSYYSGDGLNKAQVRPSQVYAAMGLTPASLRKGPGDEFGGNPFTDGPAVSEIRFNHPEQEAGVKAQLKSAISETYQELGLGDAEATSGYRGADHPVEAAKATPGEHSRGGAVDLDLEGKSDEQRAAIVQKLIEKGVKRFITYSNSPNMLHVDLKDQRGNGSPYFMHDKSAANLGKAPKWFKAIAYGPTT